ncbi:hypothetical protein ICE98_01297 [Lactococcus lactis]|nr:hypothetical protein [Lactococcus lactis]
MSALVFSDPNQRQKLSNLQDEIIRTELYDRRDQLIKELSEKSVSNSFDTEAQPKIRQ